MFLHQRQNYVDWLWTVFLLPSHMSKNSLILTIGCFQSSTSSWHPRGALPDSTGSCVWGPGVSSCLADQGAGAQGVPAWQRLLSQSIQKSESERGGTQDGTSISPHTHALLPHQWQQQHGGKRQSIGCVWGVSKTARWAYCVCAESSVLCGQLVGQAACPVAEEGISSLPGNGQKQL